MTPEQHAEPVATAAFLPTARRGRARNHDAVSTVGDVTITVHLSWAATVEVRTSAGGGFALALAAPASPGDHSIAAARPTGGFAPASFTVVEAGPRAPATDPPSDPVPPAPSPQLAPDVAASAILRPARRGEAPPAASRRRPSPSR